jgi:hypothetical protein
METKQFTQHGKLMYAIFVPLIIINLYKFTESILHLGTQTKYFAILSFLFTLCLACFNKLTISITNTTVSFAMGMGLIKKSYPISEIKSCSAHKNSMINGWGIRVIQGGWLYNVSGFHSIELRFRNDTKVIRIGTNVPDEVVETINKRLN